MVLSGCFICSWAACALHCRRTEAPAAGTVSRVSPGFSPPNRSSQCGAASTELACSTASASWLMMERVEAAGCRSAENGLLLEVAPPVLVVPRRLPRELRRVGMPAVLATDAAALLLGPSRAASWLLTPPSPAADRKVEIGLSAPVKSALNRSPMRAASEPELLPLEAGVLLVTAASVPGVGAGLLPLTVWMACIACGLRDASVSARSRLERESSLSRLTSPLIISTRAEVASAGWWGARKAASWVTIDEHSGACLCLQPTAHRRLPRRRWRAAAPPARWPERFVPPCESFPGRDVLPGRLRGLWSPAGWTVRALQADPVGSMTSETLFKVIGDAGGPAEVPREPRVPPWRPMLQADLHTPSAWSLMSAVEL